MSEIHENSLVVDTEKVRRNEMSVDNNDSFSPVSS